jgi:predicted acetyltransferase
VTNSDVSLVYGKPTRMQAEVLVNMAGQAFAFDPTQWLGSLGEDGWDNMRTLSDQHGVAAGLVIHAVGQWFGGRRLASHAVTALVAAAHARRQKVGRTLTLHALREMREAKVPLSVLFASTPTFYRQLGYEPAGVAQSWRTPTHHLPSDTLGAQFVPFTAEQQEPARELYRCFASDRSGLLDRNAHFWRMQFSPYDGSRRYAYRIDFSGWPEGYVCFQHARPQDTLIVQEAIATTPRAAQAALALMSHHKSIAEWVVFPDGPQGPLHKLISGNQARLEATSKEWLLRLTDVPAALAQRGYPPLDAELQLDVVDESMPENAGRYVLRLSAGTPRVTIGGEGRIRLDVRALAAIFTGFCHPKEMQSAGLLHAEPDDLARVGAVFAGPAPFILDTF